MKNMHEFSYTNAMGGRPKGVFKIYPQKQIVFCGTTNNFRGEGPGGSTMTFAEDVLQEIARIAGIDPRNLRKYRFYDLQTQAGYGAYKPGEYSLSKLIIRSGPGPLFVEYWQRGYCGPQVLTDFASWIWGDERVGVPYQKYRSPLDFPQEKIPLNTIFLSDIEVEV